MKTAILCLITGTLGAVISGLLVNSHHVAHPDYNRDQKYNEALSREFVFAERITFKLEDIRIETYSEGRPWTRIIGYASQPGIPMTVDLLDDTGESILWSGATDDRVLMTDPKHYYFETYIGLWTRVPELKLVVTIFPDKKERTQTIQHSIPNPIHFHQLIDLDQGADSYTRSIRMGPPGETGE